jgi:multiple sugar transport system substrate-binding protein
VIDDPEVRRRLVKAIEGYTAIYRKGCTPPDAVSWDNAGNNKAFLAQSVVLTANETLSIPNALKRERPDDYHKHSATIGWPLGPRGEAYALKGDYYAAAVFKDGGHAATAEEFVRFLVADGWLAHWLDFAGERMLPPMPRLLDQPFWLDPRDQHRMASVMQASSRPLQYVYPVATGDRRHDLVSRERVWQNAISRIIADGLTPEQAVDEAIARVKQLLSE